LPAHTPHFVGRVDELNRLTARLDDGGSAVVISAINGTAGIGKTALAVHWARHVADRFPDGQLYVNLRGFHSTGVPMRPTEAIRGFLDAFAIPAERIPAGLDAQAALYRSLLADRRVLVVLDNARDADQVRPLLPGSRTCLVVVTSRDQLTDLVTWEGASPVNLDVLSHAEAHILMSHRIGSQRAAAESAAVYTLINQCAGLPLALALVAARIELNPSLRLRVLADELADEQVRLDLLDQLRAVFSWSYQYLEPSVARMFRLLGTHPGPEFSLAAAASLSGMPVAKARLALTVLTRAHLLAEPNPGRFTFHDLLRTYAADQALAIDTDDDRRAAAHRLLDHYLHAAMSANAFIAPYRDVTVEELPQPCVAVQPIESYQQAATWLETECRTLLASVRHAYRTGFDTHTWKLAWSLGAFLDRRGRWRDLISVEPCVLAAACRLGDGFAKARSHLLSDGRTPNSDATVKHRATSSNPMCCAEKSETSAAKPPLTSRALCRVNGKTAMRMPCTMVNGLWNCSEPLDTFRGKRGCIAFSPGFTAGMGSTAWPWSTARRHCVWSERSAISTMKPPYSTALLAPIATSVITRRP
jgi:hypothetical protein